MRALALSGITLLLTLAPTGAAAQFVIDPSVGIWVNADEIARLPMSGDAWDDILAAATPPCATPDLMDQGDDAEECVLAKAIVSIRLFGADPIFHPQAAALRADVLTALGQMMDEANWCENDLCPPCDEPPSLNQATYTLSGLVRIYPRLA